MKQATSAVPQQQQCCTCYFKLAPAAGEGDMHKAAYFSLQLSAAQAAAPNASAHQLVHTVHKPLHTMTVPVPVLQVLRPQGLLPPLLLPSPPTACADVHGAPSADRRMHNRQTWFGYTCRRSQRITAPCCLEDEGVVASDGRLGWFAHKSRCA